MIEWKLKELRNDKNGYPKDDKSENPRNLIIKNSIFTTNFNNDRMKIKGLKK